MIRLSILIAAFVAAALALSASAFAQQVIGEVPSPGTIEDPHAVIKLVADGPPRILLGTVTTGPDTPVAVAVAQPAH